MKKLLLSLIMIVSYTANSQEFTGRAIYDTKVDLGDVTNKLQLGGDLQDEISKAMKKASQKKFTLEFTKNESMFTEDEELKRPTTTSMGGSIQISTKSSGRIYKNLQQKYLLHESDLLDKILLVKEDIEDFGWELTNETKKIGNYTAYKATKKMEYKEVSSDDDSSSNLLSKIELEKLKNGVITAWYTPEIPVSNGPDKFGGLPGLILELHMPQMVYLCSEIVINPKKPINIKPLKGKETTREEFDKILKDRFKGNSGMMINGEPVKRGR